MQVEGETGKGDITSTRIIASITSIHQRQSIQTMEVMSQNSMAGDFHISNSSNGMSGAASLWGRKKRVRGQRCQIEAN